MDTQEAIAQALATRGTVTQACPENYFDETDALREIGWRPEYMFIVDGEAWAVSVFVGDFVPDFMPVEMTRAREAGASIKPAFFVPNDEGSEIILPICVDNGIEMIARVGGSFAVLPLHELPVTGELSGPVECRIPPALVRRASDLSMLDGSLAAALADFAGQYLQLADEGQLGAGNEDREEALLRDALLSCLRADPRFAAPCHPLDILRFIEQHVQGDGKRDHYFHAFHDFLLGCVVISEAYGHFQQFAQEVMGLADLSVEYIWLLTSLFHDVGYALELEAEVRQLLYGVSLEAEFGHAAEMPDHVRANRQALWNCDQYVQARLQIVSLWDYLKLEELQPPWMPEPLQVNGLEHNDFDKALREGFTSPSCHGVASCLRLLVSLQDMVRSERNYERRKFLISHIYLAGLSIPFHHGGFRGALRSVGINRVSTYRFPFASLLMFIDSIQDDRRDFDLTTAAPDLLQGVRVTDHTVTAVIVSDALSGSQVHQVARKRKEALDVLDFLEQDGLRYRYPPEFLGEAGNSGSP